MRSTKFHYLVPEAIYRGSEDRSESPLVESVGNLTSMLSQVQKLNLDDTDGYIQLREFLKFHVLRTCI